ncbi:MAG TPA: 1-deoxy-D-xylulose-5-phosphate reductoisomerase [Vicinamibacteria bacterium]|nr:1-deoxy-D-xylulose-5-phosphate reductoisomerase [Vicinamibacteria bacterium]
MKGLSILGSTGSVGMNVLRIVDAFPGRFEVVGLAAGSNARALAEQMARHRPRVVSLATAEAAEELARLIDVSGVRVGVGEAGSVAVATHPEARMVVAAAVGAVGLVPTYRALEAGKDVALANKETLVMAGELMVARAKHTGARLLPIDSEHCALHQCLHGRRPEEVRKLVLTASGGPFRDRPGESFERITTEEALNHPTWNMGRKISIDSATLMNKGLEVIEARWLFDIPSERIAVLIHPQSVVHSMVEFVDGTVLAQLGVTDMRLPIQYALSYPEVWEAAIAGMDFTRGFELSFDTPDHRRFPCLGLAYRALAGGGSLPAVLNATNEEAVACFLDGRIPFTAIPEAIAEVMEAHPPASVRTLEDVLQADTWARSRARQALSRRAAARVGS